MSYQVNLDFDDYVSILDVLTKAQKAGIINWSAAWMLCKHTRIID